MKMNYEKPLVAVERYELSQAIASCITKIGFTNSTCVIDDRDAPFKMKQYAELFGMFSTDCTVEITTTSFAEGVSEDGICYHSTINSAFTS